MAPATMAVATPANEIMADTCDCWRQSMYDTFGDKQKLYFEALRRYHRDNGSGVAQRLEAAPSPLQQHAAPQPKSFSPLVRQFLDYLHLEKHFSDYTVKSYGADLIQFGQYLNGDIGPAAPGRMAGTLEDLALTEPNAGAPTPP